MPAPRVELADGRLEVHADAYSLVVGRPDRPFARLEDAARGSGRIPRCSAPPRRVQARTSGGRSTTHCCVTTPRSRRCDGRRNPPSGHPSRSSWSHGLITCACGSRSRAKGCWRTSTCSPVPWPRAVHGNRALRERPAVPLHRGGLARGSGEDRDARSVPALCHVDRMDQTGEEITSTDLARVAAVWATYRRRIGLW